MALPEDQATEVIIHLRPHLIATSGSTPASWWEYTVSSCVGTDQLRDNSRGLVTIDYEDTHSEQMSMEDTKIEARQIADYYDILRDCPETYAKERFYQHRTKASWSYGELFQGVENCHPGNGKTTFDIRLVDIGETFSKGQLDRPFLINAASLDTVFQSWLGATYNNGAFEFDKPFVPTSIGELEISVNIPADADYVMPGLCRAERYGFNELSADIVCFDTEMSKVFLSVKDFRTSELEMDAGKPDEESTGVDPADITSEVQWKHTLGLLQLEEISQVLSVVAAQDRLTEVGSELSPLHPFLFSPFPSIHPQLMHVVAFRMVLHDDPAATVVELISNPGEIPNAAVSRLPASAILPGHIRYALVNDAWEVADNDRDTSKSIFSLLGEDNSPLLVDNDHASANLLVISYQVEDAGSLEHLISHARLRLAKSHAKVIVAVSNGAAASGLVATNKGFEIVSSIADGKSVALYSHKELQTKTNANGVSKHEVAILKPARADSTITQEFSSMLEKALENRGYTVITQSWGADISLDGLKAKTYVSLLELERPILDNLSERDFHNIRAVVLNCEQLLWITHGENPSFGMVDGFSRRIMSEIASTKFQLLHLSKATGLQHGPSLATRVLESDGSDNEYREVGGILQVARIFKSPKQNESVRHHLEDSTRLVTLADQDDALRLSIGKPGLLDTLRFVSDERMLTPLEDHEVEIQVKATGLK